MMPLSEATLKKVEEWGPAWEARGRPQNPRPIMPAQASDHWDDCIDDTPLGKEAGALAPHPAHFCLCSTVCPLPPLQAFHNSAHTNKTLQTNGCSLLQVKVLPRACRWRT